jgi:hypothetical protein
LLTENQQFPAIAHLSTGSKYRPFVTVLAVAGTAIAIGETGVTYLTTAIREHQGLLIS